MTPAVTMALEEKPLLPHSQVPPSSKASGAPPSIVVKPRRASTSGSLGRSLAARRRWLLAFAVYAVVGLPVKMPSGLRWPMPYTSAGGRVVYNALGEAFPMNRTFARLHFAPTDDDEDRPGSTALGPSADAAYHLYPPGAEPSLAEYVATLERFLRSHFPARDVDESDPSSLINAMRSFIPHSRNSRWPAGAIPRKVWQTAPDVKHFASREASTRTWLANDTRWKVERQDNDAADRWVRERFTLGREEMALNETKGIVAAWDRLAEPGVLRSDFWRYLVLAVEGGVYADTDVECLKPFEQWAYDASWEGKRRVCALHFERSRACRLTVPPLLRTGRRVGSLLPSLSASRRTWATERTGSRCVTRWDHLLVPRPAEGSPARPATS